MVQYFKQAVGLYLASAWANNSHRAGDPMYAAWSSMMEER